MQRVNTGDLSASELQADFTRLYSSRESLTQQLVAEKSAKELKILAMRFGCMDAKRNTKQQNGEHAVRAMMLAYTLNNSVTYQPFSDETYEEAIQNVVESITNGMIQAQIKANHEKLMQIEKSLTNPETLSEFRCFH